MEAGSPPSQTHNPNSPFLFLPSDVFALQHPARAGAMARRGGYGVWPRDRGGYSTAQREGCSLQCRGCDAGVRGRCGHEPSGTNDHRGSVRQPARCGEHRHTPPGKLAGRPRRARALGMPFASHVPRLLRHQLPVVLIAFTFDQIGDGTSETPNFSHPAHSG